MPAHTGHLGRRSVAAAVAAELSENIETLARDLLGPPDFRNATELRWGEKAGMRVTIAGPYRGRFKDFVTNQHGDALDFVRRTLGSTPGEALGWARAWLGTPTTTRQVAERPAEPDRGAIVAADAEHRAVRAVQIWAETKPLQGSVVQRYLRSRGLALPLDGIEALRFHPKCPRGPLYDPAMIGLLRDVVTGEPCGIHRTFLKPDGSAKIEPKHQAKRMLGRAGGAAIMLTPFEEVTISISICEGIETGVALLGDSVAPIWACGSATNLRVFPILGGIETLTIYADNDGTGLGAAETCAERWRAAGKEVRVFVPDQAGADFADLVRERAA